jgi:hypothetical protein
MAFHVFSEEFAEGDFTTNAPRFFLGVASFRNLTNLDVCLLAGLLNRDSWKTAYQDAFRAAIDFRRWSNLR